MLKKMFEWLFKGLTALERPWGLFRVENPLLF